MHSCAYIVLVMVDVAAKTAQHLNYTDVAFAAYVLQIDVLYTLHISGVCTFCKCLQCMANRALLCHTMPIVPLYAMVLKTA